MRLVSISKHKTFFWHFWWTFGHSKCKHSTLCSQCWMQVLVQFSNTVVWVAFWLLFGYMCSCFQMLSNDYKCFLSNCFFLKQNTFGQERGHLKKFLCDYESSLLEAIEVELPGCKPQGCFFHKRQAQKRKLGELHMLKKLKEDEEFLHSFNCFSALAFVDPQDVKTLFNLMIAEPRFHPDLKDYADQYVRPTWIEGPNGTRPSIRIKHWTCFYR